MSRWSFSLLVMVLVASAGDLAAQQAPHEALASTHPDFAVPAPVEPLPPILAEAISRITTEALTAHIAFLASPSLAGRGLGDRGLESAAEYAAAVLGLAGVDVPEPGGRFQLVPLRRVENPRGSVAVARRRGETVDSRLFSHGADLLLPATSSRRITAPVVFGGYGLHEPDLGREDLRDLELHGKVLLLVGGLPPGPEWHTEELERRYDADDLDDRYTAKLDLARAAGAVAVLAVEPETWPERVERAAAESVPAFLPLDGIAVDAEPPLVQASVAVAEALLGVPAGSLASEPPRPLPDVTATLDLQTDERVLTSRNVFGVIPGSDETLRGEIVMLGAHLDHLGRFGGEVHPGADDNGSGAAALLEIARVLAAADARPKRTIVVAFWTGEEEGKRGSGHFVRRPLWPLAKTTYLNLDMIGHPWLPEEIGALVEGAGLADAEAFLAGLDPADFVEPGIPPDTPEIEAALRRAASGTGLTLHFDRTDGIHGGSDYRDFARAGVPFVRFFGNYFPAYHEPGDTAGSLDPAQVQRVARLALATAWLLADRG